MDIQQILTEALDFQLYRGSPERGTLVPDSTTAATASQGGAGPVRLPSPLQNQRAGLAGSSTRAPLECDLWAVYNSQHFN